MVSPVSALNDLLENAIALAHTNQKVGDLHEERIARLEALCYHGNGDSFATKLRLLAQQILDIEIRRLEIERHDDAKTLLALETANDRLHTIEMRLQGAIDTIREEMRTWKTAQQALVAAQTQGRWHVAAAVLAAIIAATAAVIVAWLKK